MKISFDSKGDFNVIRSWLNTVSRRDPSMALNQIAREGTRSLKDNTPRDTGETSSGWVSEVTTYGNVSEVYWMNKAHPESKINVAKLIELGHGTGTGGYVKPQPYIKDSMKNIWKNVDNKVVKGLIR